MAEEQLQPVASRPRSAFSRTLGPPLPVQTEQEELEARADNRFTKEYWTPERREEQRQKALEQIRKGEFGAANGFHRRKTKKWYEIAAEHAQSQADKMISKLDGMLEQNKDKYLQLKAIEHYGMLEERAIKNSREDERELRGMTNVQLEERLLDVLGDALGLDLSVLVGEEIPDAEVVEDQPALEQETGAEASYDPMATELGGDRLRDAAQELEGEDVDDEA